MCFNGYHSLRNKMLKLHRIMCYTFYGNCSNHSFHSETQNCALHFSIHNRNPIVATLIGLQHQHNLINTQHSVIIIISLLDNEEKNLNSQLLLDLASVIFMGYIFMVSEIIAIGQHISWLCYVQIMPFFA